MNCSLCGFAEHIALNCPRNPVRSAPGYNKGVASESEHEMSGPDSSSSEDDNDKRVEGFNTVKKRGPKVLKLKRIFARYADMHGLPVSCDAVSNRLVDDYSVATILKQWGKIKVTWCRLKRVGPLPEAWVGERFKENRKREGRLFGELLREEPDTALSMSESLSPAVIKCGETLAGVTLKDLRNARLEAEEEEPEEVKEARAMAVFKQEDFEANTLRTVMRFFKSYHSINELAKKIKGIGKTKFPVAAEIFTKKRGGASK